MTDNLSNILSGPERHYDIPKESFGKYLFECLRKRDYDDVVNIDAVTGEVLTSGKLLEDSVKFTAILRSLAIERDDAIAIVAENTLNYFVPVLSALYIGAVVCPLNPAYLRDELKHGLLLSKPKMIICSKGCLENVLMVKRELEFIETVLIMGARSEDHPNIHNIEELLEAATIDTDNFKPEQLDYVEQGAFILLSSGTTGLPKGVLITHQNLTTIGYLPDSDYGNIKSHDTTLLVLPFFHIFGVLIQISGIAFSIKIVLMEKFKPDTFLQAIQDYKVTKLFMVPPLVLFLAKSPLVSNYDMSSVKEILCGAAPLGKDMQSTVIERLQTIKVRQLYGLTEAGGACTFHATNTKPGSAGVLVPRILAKVCSLDSNQALGSFKVGELCFKGPMIMKGYTGDETATKASFDDDGFIHTGDLGYYDDDKCFYIVDRLKELIKYKGFQVAPAELEALIVTHPGVKECGVIGIPDERAGELPLAFVVRQNGAKVTEQDVVEYVAKRISVQKHLYGGVRFIEEVPKNPSGKILRRKLVEMYKVSA